MCKSTVNVNPLLIFIQVFNSDAMSYKFKQTFHSNFMELTWPVSDSARLYLCYIKANVFSWEKHFLKGLFLPGDSIKLFVDDALFRS